MREGWILIVDSICTHTTLVACFYLLYFLVLLFYFQTLFIFYFNYIEFISKASACHGERSIKLELISEPFGLKQKSENYLFYPLCTEIQISIVTTVQLISAFVSLNK